MDTQEFIYRLQGYIKEIINDLEAVKKISDLEEKWNKVNFDTAKHSQNFEFMKASKPEEVSYHSYSMYSSGDNNSLERYEKEIKKLREFQTKLLQKSSKIREQKQKDQRNKVYELKSSHCSYCKNKPPTNHYIYSTKNKILKPRKRNASLFNEWLFCSEVHFEKWHKKNYFCCGECNKESWDGQYKKNKKDSQKFCSDNCYYTHYAESCDNCYEKCLKYSSGKATGHAQTYYRDGINKTGILCSKCHQVQLKEEREEKRKGQEWENNSKRLSKNMDDLVDGMVEAVEGKEDDGLDDSEIADKKNNSIVSREREREREKPTISSTTSPLTTSNPLLSPITN